MAQIAVLGAGAWGTTLGVHIARQQHPVTLWSRSPEKARLLQEKRENEKSLPGISFPDLLSVDFDLAKVLKQAEELVIAVPSQVFSECLMLVSALKLPPFNLYIATKGMDPHSSKRLDEVVQDIFGKQVPFGILSGPSFAVEVAKNKPTALVFATQQEALMKKAWSFLSSPSFRIYHNEDLIGVEIAGVIKNVLGIAAGIADGLELGENAKATLITRGLVEMIRMATFLGAKTETLYGLSGLGDLVLTCSSLLSRNKRFGIEIGKGRSVADALQKVQQTVEGYSNAKILYQLCQKHRIDMPISEQIYFILYEHKSPLEALQDLSNRQLKTE